LKLRVETPSGGASANIINQGQTGADWHNIWGGFSIPGIRVTDGTVTVAFTASASADYWGYLDNITLVKTGDLPDTTPPGEVTGTAVAEGDGQLALSWTDPGDSDLEKIIIEQMDGTVADAVYAAKGAEHAVISGLTNGTSYTFKLSTVDLTGNRSAGIPITGTPAKASDDNNGNDDDDGDDDNNNNNNHDDGSEGQEPSGFPSPWAAAPAYSVGKGMIKVQPVIDANGDAVIQLRAADMEAAMLDSSVQTLTIEIANLDNAREVKVDIPYQPILAAGDDAIDTIKVDMGFTTLSFLTSLFAGKEGTAGSSLQLTVAKVGKDSLPAAVQERIGDHAVYDFSLTLDGQPITGFNGNEMQIAIAYKLMTGENPNKIIVYYSMMRVI
ncbi:hypothetical protein K0U00_28240, partial [Paenibacillus sepulcri]|nr:hypothetical protein [Paenibacillus sepulcri]